jgi:hypothetical protein
MISKPYAATREMALDPLGSYNQRTELLVSGAEAETTWLLECNAGWQFLEKVTELP